MNFGSVFGLQFSEILFLVRYRIFIDQTKNQILQTVEFLYKHILGSSHDHDYALGLGS